MTIICAYKRNGKIWMGSDSRVTSDHYKSSEDTPKLFRKGNWLFGISGLSDIRILAEREIAKIDVLSIESIEMLMDKVLEGGKFIPFEGDGLRRYPYEMIVANGSDWFPARFWEANGTALLYECTNNFTAIGSGHAYASGAYFAQDEIAERDPQELLRTCIEAAIWSRTDCGGDIIVMEV